MDFVKMEGLGNDFVVLDGPLTPSAGDVQRWCDRRHGIGADGVLVVTRIGHGRVRMDYWNRDGSPAEMCGNGLRCVARLAHERGWVSQPEFVVETAVGERPCRVNGETVRVLLGRVGPSEPETVAIEGVEIHPMELGNPHAVVFVEEVGSAPVEELGPVLERAPRFPQGTNVEFVAVKAPEHLMVRVWERGVGETLACGTGAAAAAAAALEMGLGAASTVVELPGGPLRVDVVDGEAWIEGPARVVFSGRWEDG